MLESGMLASIYGHSWYIVSNAAEHFARKLRANGVFDQANVRAMKRLKADRRTERTRAALESTFVGLLLTKGYDAVSVEDVARQANIGRSTFYLHYRGKDDLLRQTMKYPSSFLAVIVGHEVTLQIVVGALEHFFQQKHSNRNFFSPPLRGIWTSVLAELIEARLEKIPKRGAARALLPYPMIAIQIAEAQIGLITHWLLGKSSVKPATLAEALIASTRALVVALLRCRPEAQFIPGETLSVLHR
jgi:AcrR family transcriptional regulator